MGIPQPGMLMAEEGGDFSQAKLLVFAGSFKMKEYRGEVMHDWNVCFTARSCALRALHSSLELPLCA